MIKFYHKTRAVSRQNDYIFAFVKSAISIPRNAPSKTSLGKCAPKAIRETPIAMANVQVSHLYFGNFKPIITNAAKDVIVCPDGIELNAHSFVNGKKPV